MFSRLLDSAESMLVLEAMACMLQIKCRAVPFSMSHGSMITAMEQAQLCT